jgi:hypothetical protein
LAHAAKKACQSRIEVKTFAYRLVFAALYLKHEKALSGGRKGTGAM